MWCGQYLAKWAHHSIFMPQCCESITLPPVFLLLLRHNPPPWPRSCRSKKVSPTSSSEVKGTIIILKIRGSFTKITGINHRCKFKIQHFISHKIGQKSNFPFNIKSLLWLQWIKLEIVQNFGFHPKLWFSPKKLCHAVFCQCVLLWLTIEDSGKFRNFHSASCQGWFEIYSNPIKLKVNNSGEFSYSQTQIHLIHLNFRRNPNIHSASGAFPFPGLIRV